MPDSDSQLAHRKREYARDIARHTRAALDAVRAKLKPTPSPANLPDLQNLSLDDAQSSRATSDSPVPVQNGRDSGKLPNANGSDLSLMQPCLIGSFTAKEPLSQPESSPEGK
jgi:hypothetical protein